MVIQALLRKDSSLCYLETHAGSGRYNLNLLKNQKVKEYSLGVEKLFKYFNSFENNQACKNDIELLKCLQEPSLLQYLNILNQIHYPHYYPGSPLIASSCLHPQDKMILIEKHPKEYQHLKQLFKTINGDGIHTSSMTNIAIHELDGFMGIKAFLPPKEKRGLIFIDPPFESEKDWQQIVEAISLGLKRFSHGVYIIWYPIKKNKSLTDFKKSLKEIIKDKESLNCELSIYNEDINLGLRGSGLMIINPPWQIGNSFKTILPGLWKLLSWEGQGGYLIN